MKWDIQNIEDGVYTDMPIDVYHENKTHYSSSSIKEAFKSMAHFKAYLEKPNERKVHFDFGNAFELNISDEKEFNKSIAVFDPDARPEPEMTFGSKANKEWKANFYKANENKLIIPLSGPDSADTLLLCKKSLFQHPAATALLSNTEYQTSIFWTDPDTGLKLKTRPDFWKPANSKRSAVVTDLKTDKSSESDSHLKTIQDLKYPIQACLQLKGLKHAKLIDDSARFFWVVASKSIPYNTEVYEFDSTDIEAFTEQLNFKIGEIKRASDAGVFLSYEPNIDMGIKTVNFPYWYLRKMGITEQIGEELKSN